MSDFKLTQLKLHDVCVALLEESAVVRRLSAIRLQVDDVSVSLWSRLKTTTSVSDEFLFVSVGHSAAVNVKSLPFSLHPVGKDALRVFLLHNSDTLVFYLRSLSLLDHVESLISVLGGVKVVGACRIRGQCHVGHSGFGIDFEELQNKRKI